MQQNSASYDQGVLTLTGVIDIFEADSFHAVATQAADDPAPIVRVDLSRADQLDISALQILCSLRRTLEASGRSMLVSDPRTIHIRHAERLGISLATA
jgi:anti-anti-sigma regulatory factor